MSLIRSIAISKIVVIDDEESILDLLKFFLSDLGHRVETFADAGKAIDYLKATPPDLVVTDMRMPGLSGLDVCKWVVSQGNKIPILTMSGFTDAEEELKRLGIADNLRKPFGLKEFGEIVARMLKQ